MSEDLQRAYEDGRYQSVDPTTYSMYGGTAEKAAFEEGVRARKDAAARREMESSWLSSSGSSSATGGGGGGGENLGFLFILIPPLMPLFALLCGTWTLLTEYEWHPLAKILVCLLVTVGVFYSIHRILKKLSPLQSLLVLTLYFQIVYWVLFYSEGYSDKWWLFVVLIFMGWFGALIATGGYGKNDTQRANDGAKNWRNDLKSPLFAIPPVTATIIIFLVHPFLGPLLMPNGQMRYEEARGEFATFTPGTILETTHSGAKAFATKTGDLLILDRGTKADFYEMVFGYGSQFQVEVRIAGELYSMSPFDLRISAANAERKAAMAAAASAVQAHLFETVGVHAPAELALLATTDSDPSVRRLALSGISDQAVIAKVATLDKDPILRLMAVAMLTDPDLLKRIEASDYDPRIREHIEKHFHLLTVTDQAELVGIATKDGDDWIRFEAISKIQDQSILFQIAESGYNPGALREQAVSRLTDTLMLGKLASPDSGQPDQIQAAAKRRLAALGR